MELPEENDIHSSIQEEKEALVDYINERLGYISQIQDILPLYYDESLFRNISDGRLLCYLINDAVKDTIDFRAVNMKTEMNDFQKYENLNLAINSAKAIGCTNINIESSDLVDGASYLVLGFVWKIVRIGLLSKITLANHPEIFRLLEPNEVIYDLQKLSSEQILLRWINYHLKNAGSNKRVNNFSSDIKDSEAYTIVLSQIAPNQCDKSPLNETDLEKRAELTLQNADKLGCRIFVKPRDIVKGNPKLNLAFVANLFNTYPGLELLTVKEKLKLDEWSLPRENERDIRSYCLWINSFGIETFPDNLFESLKDGLVILRIMDKMEPGSVDWNRVYQNSPLNKLQVIANANYAVALANGKESGSPFKLSIPGVIGMDIVDKNIALTMKLLFNLMRHHIIVNLRGFTSVSVGKKNNELSKMFFWAINRVKSQKIQLGFKDPSLKTSIFFLELLDSIRNCVDWNLVVKDGSDDDYMQNAKYAISLARKLGAFTFFYPEDIVECKSKMNLIFVGSIAVAATKYGPLI